jgi:hypothetical protein
MPGGQKRRMMRKTCTKTNKTKKDGKAAIGFLFNLLF